MVFIGGWRSRRRRVRPQNDRYWGSDDPRYQPGNGPQFGYGRRRRGGGFGGGTFGGGGGSCLRDLFLVEGGCCLAEMLGCGPQLLLLAPTLRRRHRPADLALSPTAGGVRGGLLGRLLLLITAYQTRVSPRRRPCCRFTPTCSHYASEALSTHGLGRGLVLTARRLIRCRPGAIPGPDPVPTPRHPAGPAC